MITDTLNHAYSRGRTTTGMVISAIIHLVLNGIAVESPPLPPSAAESPNRRYLGGDYKVILHLVTVLEHGKQAKRYADLAIDLCAHIQNLREAILNFKLRPDSASAREMGLNYLIRYFYLIVFAEFVLQRREGALGRAPAAESEFSDWLRERREILNLVAKPKSIDFS